MKKLAVVSVLFVFALTTTAFAQRPSTRGRVLSPQSNRERPQDIGVRAHTNVELLMPSVSLPMSASVSSPVAGFVAETPASLACVYFLVSTRVTGCNPLTASLHATGGSKAIAIVDAYDDPNAASDLAKFSSQFGLPAANFSKVYAAGTKPAQDPTGGWELEESMDIEWAHAMAPSAKIILVEAASSSLANLLSAVSVAANQVAAAGGGEVSNSWGGGEFSGETTYDSHFIKSGVVFFAATGDAPGTEWPSVSPNVIAAGGTTISRSPSTLAFITERPWTEAGGGTSFYESIPIYQSSLSGMLGSHRGVPDLSFDADPDTGVWLYDSTPVQGQTGCCGVVGWWVTGGTSLAAPSLAGIINSAGSFSTSTDLELTTMYTNAANTSDFHDITTDYCGPFAGFTAKTGWDFCTGIGSDHGKTGK